MSMITKFYDEFLLTEGETQNQDKDNLVDFLTNFVDDDKKMLKCEELITKVEDRASEKAFTGGFKAAMALLIEAIS